MFRIFCKNQNEDGDDCTNRQEIVCAISPFYIEFIDDLIDDFISVRFNVIQRFKHHLSDEEVADWLQIDSEDAAQYANGISDFFLLSRHNAVLVGERLAEVHNARSFARFGKHAIYMSPNIVEAYRDVRIHFPNYAKALRPQPDMEAIAEVRRYAITHLMDPVSRYLSNHLETEKKLSLCERRKIRGNNHNNYA